MNTEDNIFDGRIRPVYILIDGDVDKTRVVTDGRGNCYYIDENWRPWNNEQYICSKNLIPTNIYKFLRGMSGMEF